MLCKSVVLLMLIEVYFVGVKLRDCVLIKIVYEFDGCVDRIIDLVWVIIVVNDVFSLVEVYEVFNCEVIIVKVKNCFKLLGVFGYCDLNLLV